MPTITLPDGNQRHFEMPLTIMEVAASIGPGLAKATLAGEINGQLVDADTLIQQDVSLRIITAQDKEGLEVIRHSTAHLLAQAVKQLFPTAQVTIGPVIEDGFYYDFAFGRSFTPEDVEAIEAKMAEIAKTNLPVNHKKMDRKAAIEYFQSIGEAYKVRIIQEIPEGETLNFYTQGDFTDLCRGPHVPNTSHLKAFKLTKLAGAYWRGDENNEMLQRIYGTAWPDKKALKAYLDRIEEAKKRDHRLMGKRLHLFHGQEEAPGMTFWHPKGWTIYQTIKHYIRDVLDESGYVEVNTPMIMHRSLWEKSGHEAKFSEEMFHTETEGHQYAIKPMNCPGHIQIFNQGLKSYRDLPIRMAEFGSCHRRELSGALHGLMRLRYFVQDDAHLFCTPAQIQTETRTLIKLIQKVYSHFGFHDILVKLSTRPDKRVGSDALWDEAEKALEEALNELNVPFELFPGEGAFYGPKIEFSLKDCLDRVWQCGTIQLDFFLPERLGAQYVAEDSSRQIPVMLHRAILGSVERFVGILLEHYAGFLPVWLSPHQAAILTITEKHDQHAKKVFETLKSKGFRVISDLRNEKIGFKIREHTIQRVPYLLVIGDREVENNQISVRTYKGEDLGPLTIDAFSSQLEQAIQSRT